MPDPLPPPLPMFLDANEFISANAAVLSVALNSKLIHLVATASPPQFESYASLMTANAAILIALSLLNALAQPTISVEKSVVYVFSTRNEWGLPRMVVRALLTGYGIAYCMTIVLSAVTFFYRYNKICKKNVSMFNGRLRIATWFAFVAAVGFYWGYCIWQLAAATPAVDDIIRRPLLETYGCALENVTYVAAAYLHNDTETGAVSMNVNGVTVGASFIFIITASAAVIVGCVRRIYRETKTFRNSSFYRDIEWQLWYAQCVQMTIPFLLILVPVFAVLVAPMFDLGSHVAFSTISILVSIYPVVDPIAVALLVTHYREALCGKRKVDDGTV